MHTAILELLWCVSPCVLVQIHEQILERNSQFKQLLFSMINRVWPSPELCQMSQLLRKKRSCLNESHERVCGTVSVCVCVCLADCSTQSSDIPPDSSELFTVPGLSESEKEREREREARWEGGGENHVRRWAWSEDFVCEGRRHTCLYVLAQ